MSQVEIPRVKVEKDEDVIINLILENGFKTVAEIGVWEGWMTGRVLNNPDASKLIKGYWAMDKWDVLEGAARTEWRDWANITREQWTEKYKKVCMLMRYFPALHVVRLPSVEAAKLFWPGFFDLVYIDACHWYQEVQEDIDAWLPIVCRGGILAGHDYGPVRDGSGRRSRCEVKPAVDDYFGGEENVQTVPQHMVWYKRIGG